MLVTGVVSQVLSDFVTTTVTKELKISSWQSYVGAAIGGAAGGAALAITRVRVWRMRLRDLRQQQVA